MKITIEGKQIDLGDALRERAEDRLVEAVGKYFGDGIDGSITFSRNGQMIQADCAVHIGHDIFLKSQGSDSDAHGAFDRAAERIEKQLRRYKRRLKDHHKDRSEPVELFGASSYILASDESNTADEPESLQPMIVAEMETKIPSLSVGEAVMQMELAGAPVLVFRNENKDGLNVVYRRDDGNIGWIDP